MGSCLFFGAAVHSARFLTDRPPCARSDFYFLFPPRSIHNCLAVISNMVKAQSAVLDSQVRMCCRIQCRQRETAPPGVVQVFPQLSCQYLTDLCSNLRSQGSNPQHWRHFDRGVSYMTRAAQSDPHLYCKRLDSDKRPNPKTPLCTYVRPYLIVLHCR